jgi:tripartite-type tricarboxylate transporter receptor subunit TctC
VKKIHVQYAIGALFDRASPSYRARHRIRNAGAAMRSCLAAILSLASLVAGTPALADAYPSKAIRVLVGAAGGSQLDTAARQMTERLGPALGQPLVVDNRPGAGGILALEALKASPADGHAVSIVHFAQMSVAPSLFPKLSYDPLRDFAPVGIIYRGAQVLTAHPSLGIDDFEGFVKLAKSKPGQLRYASPGNGTPTHVFMEHLKQVLAIDLQHIPYKGSAAQVAVLAGEVDVLLEGVQVMLPQVKAGKLRAIAVGGPRRVPILPDVPTFAERGVPGIEGLWIGMVAPRGTPAAAIERLNRELARMMEQPELKAQFEAIGRTPSVGSPAQMAAIIEAEIPMWREVVRRASIRPD